MAEQMKQETAGKAIPAGYKQTEVGIIPEDWDLHEFGSLVNYKKGYAFKSTDYQETGVRIVRVSDTSFSKIKDDSPVYLSQEKAVNYAAWQLLSDDLVFSTVGSKPPMYDSLVGKAIIVTSSHDGCLLNQNAVRIRAKSGVRGIQILLLNHFKTDRYIDFIEIIYRGNANQASLTLDNLFVYPIPLPSSQKEQTAIANVLSDTDALIAGLEHLIVKKQAIKCATMQQLLTGRTRLPQFALHPDGTPKGYKSSELGQIPEDWDINSINKVGSIITGRTPPTAVGCYWEGDIPWVTPTDIGDAKNIFESERRITEKGLQAIRGLPANSVLVTCIASIGKNAILKNAGACNQQINAIVPTALFDVDFLYYNIEFSKERLKQCAGITATPIISKALFSDFLLPFPSNKEQTAIATILSNMDSELQALEQKLAKARDVKQGMMQQLLTGRIRLPLPQEA